MKRREPGVAAVLLLLSAASSSAWGQEYPVVGGVVRDLRGVPQLGALVELLGTGSAVVAHTYTDDHGRYLLQAPAEGKYQLRTSAAFLLPTLRRNLSLTPQGRALVDVTLSAVFEAEDWFPVQKRAADEPKDDWRWTLRSSAERPLLRFAGSQQKDDPRPEPSLATASQSAVSGEQEDRPRWKQTVSAGYGEGSLTDSGFQQSWTLERGTPGDSLAAFADVGGGSMDTKGSPTTLEAAVQKTRRSGQTEYRIVAGAMTSSLLATGAGANGFRDAFVASGERVVLGDLVTVDAGTLLSAEELVKSQISAAPFLRVEVHPSPELQFFYSYASSPVLQRLEDVTPGRLKLPALADATGQPIATSGHHQQFAVARATPRDEVTLAIYQDAIAAGCLQGTGLARGDETLGLPILVNTESGAFTLAVAGYRAHGLSASWMYKMTAGVSTVVRADYGTTLVRSSDQPVPLVSIQSATAASTRPALMAEVREASAQGGTSLIVRYRWQPQESLTLVDSYDNALNGAYASVSLRQQVWHRGHLQHVTATLDAFNLLKEGYQPVVGSDGRTLYLAQVPRMLQAGLAFTF